MTYFNKYADFEIFGKIPAVEKEGLCVADADHYGDDNYVVALARISYDTYRDYLKLLESDGFTKYADNGENGINGNVFAANYTKDSLTVAVSFMARTGEMYISAKDGLALSDHLHKRECFNIIPEAKTTLTMHQVPEYGNCYVIRLKNGHYIVNDGGFPDNIDPLLDALEQESEGKPVVEAWFVSHEHWDHAGVLDKLAANEELSRRIAINGIYVSQVRQTVQKRTCWIREVGTCKRCAPMLQTAAGEMSAKMRAVRIVTSASVSKQELERRLVQKGENPQQAKQAVDWMSELRLVDDGETARQIVSQCIRKGYGLARAKQALYEKRIPKEFWQEALEDYPDQLDAIVCFLQTHLKDANDPKQLRKTVDALQRKGHSYSHIRKALDRLSVASDDFSEDF